MHYSKTRNPRTNPQFVHPEHSDKIRSIRIVSIRIIRIVPIRSIRIIKRALAFTLLEVLLSVALIGAISAVAIPIYLSYSTGNDIDIAGNTVAQSLRRAQVLSQANEGDSTWGVKIQSGSITLFKGATYLARDINYDEVFSVSNIIGVGGKDEFIFSKISGFPVSTGTLNLTSTNNDARNVSVNEKGTVSY